PFAPTSTIKPAEGENQTKMPAGWQEVVSKEGHYRVAMPPGLVVENTLKVPSPIGEVVVHQKILALPDYTGSYLAQYTDAVGGKPIVDAEAGLEGFKNGLLGSLQGSQATNEKKITLAGRPGREFQVAIAGKGNLMVRVYLDKNRFYSLVAGGQPGKVDAKD